MSSDIAVKVDGVSKRYMLGASPLDRLKWSLLGRSVPHDLQHWALRDISFELARGETLGIMGRNGCGKSTLLEIIVGTLAPTAGAVSVSGHMAALLELGAGFDMDLSGRENVYVYGSLLGLPKHVIDSRFDEIVGFAELESYIDEPVKAYSSGMFMRLAFSVAVNATPEILVVDEALAVGDEAFHRRCFARIDSLKEQGVSILFVSHAAGTVIELCDRVLLLDQGEKLLLGPPREVVSHYHRLIYAQSEDQEEIRREILSGVSLENPETSSRQEKPSPKTTSQQVQSDEKEEFDPALVSKSRLEYSSRGAQILNCSISAPDGTPLNVLKRGSLYFIEMEVAFDRDCFGVRYGMLIKTVVGTELGGMVSAPAGQGLEQVAKGRRVKVRLPFRPRLNSDLYFANVGVVGLAEEGEIFLHRISDALTFRILRERDSTITSSVDFSAGEEPVIEVSAPRS